MTAALVLAGSSVLLLAGCSGGMTGMSGMDHSGSGMPSSTPSAGSSSHNPQDVSFAQGMVMHHQQAIEMSDMVLEKDGVNAKVATLATDIKEAQQPEIDEMNGWLERWGEPTVSGSMSGTAHDMGSMGGDMMSQADMAALEKASGKDASSLFLTQMVVHHKGALSMARTEVAKGKNPDAIALAKAIISSQTAQITQMQDLLEQV